MTTIPRSTRRIARAWCLSGLGLLVGAAALGGTQTQKPGQAPLTFRAGIDVVQVDVSVLDRDGRPVRGLTRDTFTVLENGAPQEIVAFAAVDVPEPPALPASWLRETAPDVRTNDLGDGRLFAIILDDATLPPDARITAAARQAARRVIEGLGPEDLAAVIFVMDTRRSVEFTNDRRRLLKAIEGLAPSFAYADPVGGTERLLHFSSIRTLGRVAGHLSAVPLRRKAIVYISTGVPVDVEAAASVTLMRSGAPPLGQTLDAALEVDAAKELVEALNEVLENRPQETYGAALQDAFVRAQHGNVNIYSVDPGGLGGLAEFLQTRARPGNVVSAPLMTPMAAFQTSRLHRDFLQTVAENSGGRAILDTNDLDRGVAQIFSENSAYYLVGYRSTRDTDDRRVRRVSVRVQHAGATTRTRNAYFSPATARAVSAIPLSSRLQRALTGVLPSPNLGLRVTVAAFAQPGRQTATLAIVLGVTEPGSPGDVGARIEESVALLTSAFTPTGEARGTSRQTARVILRSGVSDEVRFDVLSRIDLPPGQYQLRLAADSALLGRDGSVYYDVEVPDFSRTSLALSGVVIGADPGVTAAPADVLADLLPLVPTTQREFTAEERAVAFVQIYQHRETPGPVTVASSVTDTDGAVVSRLTETLPSAAFQRNGTADYTFGLPLSRLRKGQYLLAMTVERGGRRASREVWFTVK